MDMQQAIEGRLKKAIVLQAFEFRDDSHLHAGHAGAKQGGHYTILVVSESFENASRLNRQRIVKEALNDLFSDGLIHALSIKAVAPDEYFS